MPKLLSGTLLAIVVLPTSTPPASADMRGQVVCDVPADEAVLLTWQTDDGSWRVTTPSGGTASFATEAAALKLWNELPVFVCDLTMFVDFRELPGRLHRLNRKLQPHYASNGVNHLAEVDPRVLVVSSRSSPMNADQTCAEMWPGASCWLELTNRPRCYVWNESFELDETAAWTGGCTGGLAHGTGWIIYPYPSAEGRSRLSQAVAGRLEHGKHQGHWVLNNADGSVDEGPYVNSVRNGTWILREADGSTSEGPYDNGRRQGVWTHRLADGTVKEGPYIGGREQGDWVLTFADGSVHRGRYTNGVQNGPWVRVDADGNEARGYVDNGKESRLWVLRFANGDVMEGRYIDGRRHGIWTRHFADGAVEKGSYVNGDKQGIWITRDGKFRYRTKYVDGKPVGKVRDAIEW